MKLSKPQRAVLSDIDWRGPDVTYVRKSTFGKTLDALVRRGLITKVLSDSGYVWTCNITDEGLYVLREAMEA